MKKFIVVLSIIILPALSFAQTNRLSSFFPLIFLYGHGFSGLSSSRIINFEGPVKINQTGCLRILLSKTVLFGADGGALFSIIKGENGKKIILEKGNFLFSSQNPLLISVNEKLIELGSGENIMSIENNNKISVYKTGDILPSNLKNISNPQWCWQSVNFKIDKNELPVLSLKINTKRKRVDYNSGSSEGSDTGISVQSTCVDKLGGGGASEPVGNIDSVLDPSARKKN